MAPTLVSVGVTTAIVMHTVCSVQLCTTSRRPWPSRPFESKLLLPCLGLSTIGRGICNALELRRCQCVWPQLSGSWHTLHSSSKLLSMHGCHSDSRPLVDVLYLHRNLAVRFSDGDRFRQGHTPTFLLTRRGGFCSLLLPVPV